MGSGLKHENQLDPLTAWELASINLLIALFPEENLDVNASRANMLALMQALDRGDLNPALADPSFLGLIESLLLAIDLAFTETLRRICRLGVEVHAFRCKVNTECIEIAEETPVAV